jgi:hypothetical protein
MVSGIVQSGLKMMYSSVSVKMGRHRVFIPHDHPHVQGFGFVFVHLQFGAGYVYHYVAVTQVSGCHRRRSRLIRRVWITSVAGRLSAIRVESSTTPVVSRPLSN